MLCRSPINPSKIILKGESDILILDYIFTLLYLLLLSMCEKNVNICLHASYNK